jgi:DNA-binding NarL/FixJ family response regulator
MDDRMPPAGVWPVALSTVLEALRVDDEVRLDLGPAGTLSVRWAPAADEPAPSGLPALDTRARAVLLLVAGGLPAAVVAETLGLPLGTVAAELTRLRARYAVDSTAAAVHRARAAGDLD